MTHTPGNWIAFQNESQKANVPQSPGEHWSVGVEHESSMCHGVGADGRYMLFSGIGTEADAKLMAASKDLLELAHQYASDLRHPPTAVSRERRLERIAAVLAKVGV